MLAACRGLSYASTFLAVQPLPAPVTWQLKFCSLGFRRFLPTDVFSLQVVIVGGGPQMQAAVPHTFDNQPDMRKFNLPRGTQRTLEKLVLGIERIQSPLAGSADS